MTSSEIRERSGVFRISENLVWIWFLLLGACTMIKIWPRSVLAPVEEISEDDIAKTIENAGF